MSEDNLRPLSRGIFVLADGARGHVLEAACLALEYRFLRFVVHAWLAKVVGIAAILAGFYLREDKNALGKLVKVVLLPLRFLLFKLSNACTEFSFPVFERIYLLGCRKHLSLQIKRGVLDLDDPFLKHLLKLGEFRLITGRNSALEEVD